MNTELLKDLSLLVAPSGAEQAVRDYIKNAIIPLADEVLTDKTGNLIARFLPKKGEAKKKVMLVAHMDEIGFMIKSIDNDGRLRLTPLGDIDTRTLSGRRVMLTSGVRGVVAAKPIHVLSGPERSKPTEMRSLYIELGTKDKAETGEKVRIGDYGSYEPKFTPLRGGKFAGKAIGGRSSVMLLLELAKELHEMETENEYDLVFSAKREIGRMQFAVETAAFNLAPDTAIVLDCEPAADFDGVKGIARGASLGAGVVISPADMKTIYDREIFAEAVRFCEENSVKFSYPATDAGEGNEAGSIHKARAGIPSLSLTIPVRNYRSGAEIIDEKDLEAAAAVLRHFVN